MRHRNAPRRFLAVLAVLAIFGCGSEPVKDIKGIFKRATEGAVAADPESPSEVTVPSEVQKIESAPPPKADAGVGGKIDRKGAPELLAGIKAYDDGQYREASKILRSALPRLDKRDQVEAHKYLAFIDCTSGRKTQCRAEFAQALKIDPSFELEPSEAGHPLWGPVFRSLKQQQKPRR